MQQLEEGQVVKVRPDDKYLSEVIFGDYSQANCRTPKEVSEYVRKKTEELKIAFFAANMASYANTMMKVKEPLSNSLWRVKCK